MPGFYFINPEAERYSSAQPSVGVQTSHIPESQSENLTPFHSKQQVCLTNPQPQTPVIEPLKEKHLLQDIHTQVPATEKRQKPAKKSNSSDKK